MPKGIAFPTCVSVNECVMNNSPLESEASKYVSMIGDNTERIFFTEVLAVAPSRQHLVLWDPKYMFLWGKFFLVREAKSREI